MHALEFMRIVRWLLALCALYAFAYILDQFGIIELPHWLKVERKLKVDKQKAECLAMAMLADTIGENKVLDVKGVPDLKDEKIKELVSGRLQIMQRIGESYLRFAITHSADLCEVTKYALSQIPVGDSRSSVYVGRRPWYVKREVGEYWWNQGMRIGEELTEMTAVSVLRKSCETQFVRATRGTWSESAETIKRLDAGTTAAPPRGDDIGKARFRCPLKK